MLVASRDVQLDELDCNAGFADERISLLSDCGAKVWLRLAASSRRCDITLLRGGSNRPLPWVQLSPEPDDLAAPYSERRDGSDGTLRAATQRRQTRRNRQYMRRHASVSSRRASRARQDPRGGASAVQRHKRRPARSRSLARSDRQYPLQYPFADPRERVCTVSRTKYGSSVCCVWARSSAVAV